MKKNLVKCLFALPLFTVMMGVNNNYESKDVTHNVNADTIEKYEIYPNKICINENPDQCRGCIEGKIKSIGRTVAKDYGFRKNK